MSILLIPMMIGLLGRRQRQRHGLTLAQQPRLGVFLTHRQRRQPTITTTTAVRSLASLSTAGSSLWTVMTVTAVMGSSVLTAAAAATTTSAFLPLVRPRQQQKQQHQQQQLQLPKKVTARSSWMTTHLPSLYIKHHPSPLVWPRGDVLGLGQQYGTVQCSALALDYDENENDNDHLDEKNDNYSKQKQRTMEPSTSPVFPFAAAPFLTAQFDARGRPLVDASSSTINGDNERSTVSSSTTTTTTSENYVLIEEIPERYNNPSHALRGSLSGQNMIQSFDVYQNRQAVNEAHDWIYHHQKRQQQEKQNSAVNGESTNDVDVLPIDPIVMIVTEVGTKLNGHPEIVHGGILALLLDEAMGCGFGVLGIPIAFTANLNIDYRNPVAAGTTLVMRVRLLRQEKRKLWLQTDIMSTEGDVLYCQATALFIVPRHVYEKIELSSGQ